MRLRTRRSNDVDPVGREALGDISNKRSAPENLKKVSAAKKLRTAIGSIAKDLTSSKHDSQSTKPITDEENEDSSVEVVEPVLIPHQYRLYRSDFDGCNHTEGVAPHDFGDLSNEFKISHYVTDLFQHMFRAESKYAPATYMDKQEDINSRMRAILVDWLIEVHMKFRLVPETLYLCINIIDRYCSIVCVPRSKLQLVGVTSLLIACKYEEIYPPEVRDCVYITDRAYKREEVLAMEQSILEKLRFDITVPTAYPFLLRFLNIIRATRLIRHASNYYMERTLQEHDMLKFRPSLVAMSAVILALNNRDIIGMETDGTNLILPGFPLILLEYSGYSKEEIFKCVSLIAKKVAEEPVTASRRELVAVKRKYDSSKFECISSRVLLPEASVFHQFLEMNEDENRR
eukprot:CAMPEP_0113315454 /NCGR_PEP_ID=MMETSP0010_2-20120614/11116_1 /TAXON_ID=216773 ORGANISM="Corethron hystrix, Strain 308" /NCGR_SAMPLE_ID=MMETSP0010_2 /ASSEMBLY_ACC=CAM_ASM_000155 /LENGTH=401 /DNA_ID=CAMNT_0000171959 /DNA_START=257 /DNA_END=1462 /DNA_ORIENTATION=+ /assembly_acc=CAM_ASM_000155